MIDEDNVIDITKPRPRPDFKSTDVRDGTATTKPLTELGNAYRLNDLYGTIVRYIPEIKEWIMWRNDAWCLDVDAAMIRELSAKLHQIIYEEAGHYYDDRVVFSKWSRETQKKRVIEAAVALLSDMSHVRRSAASLDAENLYVGINNARHLIDLKTGKVRPCIQEDYLTKALNVSRLGDASKAVRWQSFLTEIFSDAELIDWLKRWCGYLLTGDTSEHLLVFGYGLGANGKSVLADVLRYILGDYARAISSESLTDTKRQAGGASPDLANLIGARLAIACETEDGAPLAESLVKSLVSGDTMSVRKLYCSPIQMTPRFKLMMFGNHKPVIRGTDNGIWRRMRLIPFNRIFTANEIDTALPEKLKLEAPHILAWMVDGCLDWQRRGLKDTPKVIEEATNAYREEQDLIGGWLDECCELNPLHETPSTKLYENYNSWAVSNGLKPCSSTALARRLSERGFNRRKSHGVRRWQGIGLTF